MCVYVRDKTFPQHEAVRKDDEERRRGRDSVSDGERGFFFFFLILFYFINKYGSGLDNIHTLSEQFG